MIEKRNTLVAVTGCQILAAALLFSSLCVAQNADQPLGDVARHKSTDHKAARVVTNDEIPSVSQAQADALNASAGDKESSSGQAAQSDKNSNPPAAKGKVNVPGLLTNGTPAQAQSLLDSLKHDRQSLIDNYKKIEEKLAQTSDDSLRQVYMTSLARRDETLAKNQKQIDDTEKAIQSASQASSAQGDNQQ